MEKLFRSSNKKFYQNDSGRNPRGPDGAVTTCRSCGSRNHWVRDCPDKEKREEDKEKAFLSLASLSPSMLNECTGRGILDTACTKFVCGEVRMLRYLHKIAKFCQKMVNRSTTRSRIMFGDGSTVKSLECVTVPIQLADLVCTLKVEVLPGNLLSIESMKRASIISNLKDNTLTLPGSEAPLKLEQTSTGHLTVSLIPPHQGTDHLALIANDGEISEKQVLKLYRQFAHCHEKRLLNLLKSAGQEGKKLTKLVASVVSACGVCVKFGRAKPRPVVTMPLSTHFNGVVALDLHQLAENYYYLHIIDVFTRFSQAILITDKRAETIVAMFNKVWTLYLEYLMLFYLTMAVSSIMTFLDRTLNALISC